MSGLVKEYSLLLKDIIMTLTKTQFVCVQPKTTYALEKFDSYMNKLHSCRVVIDKEQTYVLASITNKYSFEMGKEYDEHWEIIK